MQDRDDPPHPDEGPPGDKPVEAWPPDAFERWWEAWPNKVGIGAARRAFAKVRKSGQVGFAALVAALERYKRCKPVECAWCNPGTWLNQERWLDEWPAEAGRPPGGGFDRIRVGPESGVAGISSVIRGFGARPPTLEGDRP